MMIVLVLKTIWINGHEALTGVSTLVLIHKMYRFHLELKWKSLITKYSFNILRLFGIFFSITALLILLQKPLLWCKRLSLETYLSFCRCVILVYSSFWGSFVNLFDNDIVKYEPLRNDTRIFVKQIHYEYQSSSNDTFDVKIAWFLGNLQ